MLRTTTKYVLGLVALYLVVYNGSKSGQVIREGSKGASGVIKTLQGR